MMRCAPGRSALYLARVAVSGFFFAATLCVGAQAQTAPANAITAPAAKPIGGPNKPEMEPSLIVLNSDGAKLSGGKLVLTGVSANAIVFADRPVRAAGHVHTKYLIEEWADGSDSFAKDPPNATVSVLHASGDDVKDVVVTLSKPKFEGTTLTFDVAVLEGSLEGADGPASIFIDIIGMPLTPGSYAGVARRTARRTAWYGAAPVGAAVAGAAVAGAAVGATAAAAAAAPYYYPPPPRPACGYYPYPPCY